MDDKKLLPQDNSINTLLIKPADISNFDYRNPDYKELLLNLDIYEKVEIKADSFGNNLYEYLDMKDYSNVTINTQAIYQDNTYLYELIHLDLPLKHLPVEIYNGMANMLKNDIYHIFGKAMLVKTTADLTMVNCDKKDLEKLLLARVKHKGVTIDLDGEIEEIEFWYEPKQKLEEFFSEGKTFTEDVFLLYNLQIYYTKGDNPIIEDIIGEKVEQLMILTKNTDTIYGDFTLGEFNNIINLLKKGCSKITKEEWKEEKKDKYNRNTIINKYTVLKKALIEYGL